MGSAIAIREGTEIVEGTPELTKDLTAELRDITKALKVRQRLRGWTKALTQLPKRNTNKARWLLLVLDVTANTIQATGYNDSKTAFLEYAQVEKSGLASQTFDAVLVSVASISDLKAGYPNYYADTVEFIGALDAALKLT